MHFGLGCQSRWTFPTFWKQPATGESVMSNRLGNWLVQRQSSVRVRQSHPPFRDPESVVSQHYLLGSNGLNATAAR